MSRPMRIAIPYEIAPDEARVALIPETVARLVKSGLAVSVQAGAGESAAHTDPFYAAAGATLVPDARTLYAAPDVVLKGREPLPHPALGGHEADLFQPRTPLIPPL